MFEFFLALFGGAYYGAKIASDKAALKANNRASETRLEWHENRVCNWEKQVVDRVFEEDLRNLILSSLSSDEKHKEVWEAVRAAYMQMPSRQDEIYASSSDMMNISNFHIFGYTGPITYSQLPPQKRKATISNWINETLDIMLAQRGKIRSELISHYIESGLPGFTPGRGEYTKEEWDKKFDFWMYIRDELRRHDREARLIFHTGYAGTGGPGVAYDADDVDKFRYQYGELMWLPLTYFDDNLCYVSAR